MIRYFFTITCVLLFSLGLHGQNMIHNYSFEQDTACPYYAGHIEYATDWSTGAAIGSTDLFDSCCIGCNAGVPQNLMGYRHSYQGNKYAGFIVYYSVAPNDREYLLGTLDPLVVGHWYKVKMQLALAGGSIYGSNNISAFFYTHQTLQHDNLPQPFVPQVDYSGDSVITDTINWTERSTIFYADSAYTRILIGNFRDDAHTNHPFVQQTNSLTAYYYIDNVAVEDITQEAVTAPADVHAISISPNPFDVVTTITIDKPHQRPYIMELYNMQGKLLRSVNNITGSSTTLQRDGLPAGIYYYRLCDAGQCIDNGRVEIR